MFEGKPFGVLWVIAKNLTHRPFRKARISGDFGHINVPDFFGWAIYRHRVPGTPVNERVGFSSPWRTQYVDRIVQFDPANIGIARTPTAYAVEAVVPFDFLGLSPQPGKSYKADFGILTADSGGNVTVVRSYWANPATGLVSDARQ